MLWLPMQDDITFQRRQAATQAALQKRLLVLFHAWVQVRAPEVLGASTTGLYVLRALAGHVAATCCIL